MMLKQHSGAVVLALFPHSKNVPLPLHPQPKEKQLIG